MFFPQSYRIFMGEKCTLPFILVYLIYVFFSVLQSQENKNSCTLIKGPSGQYSDPTAARNKCIWKRKTDKVYEHLRLKLSWTLTYFQDAGFPGLDKVHSVKSSPLKPSWSPTPLLGGASFFFSPHYHFPLPSNLSTTCVVKKHLDLSFQPFMPPISRQTSLSVF